jgi:putative photosynthetic complex assembly protein
MSVSTQEIIHQRAVKGAIALLVVTVVLTAAVQLTGGPDRYEPQGEAVASAQLFFTDEPDGFVAVFDAETGVRLTEYGENEGVFVRSVMRGVARQRRMRGLGQEEPVELSRLSDGQLWLVDQATGIDIYLGAFGPDNSRAFGELLDLQEGEIGAQAEAVGT